MADYVEVNGLYPSPYRRALLKAIDEGKGRIYYEPESRAAWDFALGTRVTARVFEMLQAEWITAEKVDHSTKRPGELAGRTYYRLTDAGRSIVERGRTR